MHRKTLLLIGVAAVLSILGAIPAIAVTYNGSLQYTPPYPADSADGLFVGPSTIEWPGYTITISWTVTDEDNSYTGFPWKYTYTFGHNGSQAALSHIIIEGSEGISEADIAGTTGATLDSVELHKVQSGNQDMPEDMNGLKFQPNSEDFSITWSFWSNRMPVWGDFYAKDGGTGGQLNHAYNYNLTDGTELGFLANDIDPTAPASSGSVDYHILRPDSVVPEPSSLLALLTGLGAAGGLAFRKRR